MDNIELLSFMDGYNVNTLHDLTCAVIDRIGTSGHDRKIKRATPFEGVPFRYTNKKTKESK